MLFINGILTTLMIGLMSCAAIKEETAIENNASNKDCPCTLIIHCTSLSKKKGEVTEIANDCPEPNLVRCCGESVDDRQTENVTLLAQNTLVKDLSAKNLTKQTSMNTAEFNINSESPDLLKNDSDIIIVYPWIPNSQSGGKFRSHKLISTQSAFDFEDQKVVVVYPVRNANNNASEIDADDEDLLVAASSSIENTVETHVIPLLNDKNETSAHDADVGDPSTLINARNVTETTLKPETKAINGNPLRRKYRRRKPQRKIATIENNTLQNNNNRSRIEDLTPKIKHATKMNRTNLTSVIGQNMRKTFNVSKRLDMNNTKIAHNIFDNSRRAVLFKERNKKKVQPVMNLTEMLQDTNFTSVDNVHRHVVEHMRGNIITSSTSYQSELPFWPELKTYKKNDRSNKSHLVGVVLAQKSMKENINQSESTKSSTKEAMQDKNGRFAKRGRCRFMTCAR